jgi:hypothetical protein
MDTILDGVIIVLSVVTIIVLAGFAGRVLGEIASTLLRGIRRSKLRRFYSSSELSDAASRESSGRSDTSSEPSRHDAA